jgi:hypothetical protein
MTPPMVALAMPTGSAGGRIDPEALAMGTSFKATEGRFAVEPRMCPSSLLTMSFNVLWAGCLNERKAKGYRYFAMIHDDICPQRNWLDILIDELEAHDADVVSAVVPIKEPTGVTSTAMDDTGDEWSPRRLTLNELWPYDPATEKNEYRRKRLGPVGWPGYPETFTAPKILLNSGLWVCRFDRPWCEDVYFRQMDEIKKLPDGNFAVRTRSEDWEFSRTLRAKGCKLYATRKIQLEHERAEWHTRHPWGTWDRDRIMDFPTTAVQKAPMGIGSDKVPGVKATASAAA